jgi:hypothetical protein
VRTGEKTTLSGVALRSPLVQGATVERCALGALLIGDVGSAISDSRLGLSDLKSPLAILLSAICKLQLAQSALSGPSTPQTIP